MELKAELSQKNNTISIYDRSYGIIPLIKKAGNDYDIILIKHASGGEWDFPKGHPEKEDESTIVTAIREFKEELGVDYTLEIRKEKSFEKEFVFTNSMGQIVHKTVELWIGLIKDTEVPEFKPKLSEISEIRRCNPLEALELIAFEESKRLLKEALLFIKNSEL